MTCEAIYTNVYLTLDIPLTPELITVQNHYLDSNMTSRGHLQGDGTQFLHLTLGLLGGGITETQLEEIRRDPEFLSLVGSFSSPLRVLGVGGAVEYPRTEEGNGLFEQHMRPEDILNLKKNILALSGLNSADSRIEPFNKVTWIAIEKSPELMQLREAIRVKLDSILVKHAIKPMDDAKTIDYSPHITLGSYCRDKPKYDSHGHPKLATLASVESHSLLPRTLMAHALCLRSGDDIVWSCALSRKKVLLR